MGVLKAIGGSIKNFMIIFSFIVNLVLIIVLVVLGLLIFDIKNNIATPLVAGLHSSFVGLDQSTIDWTIPVRDRIPVVLNIPLNTDTVVTLTEAVPLAVSATITLPGVGQLNNAQVFLQLPAGLELPVHLDLNVPVDEELDVSLDVRAVIPIEETQLHDPIDNLRLLFEPLTRGLYNLPDNFGETGEFVGDILGGQPINLLAENDYSRDPWPGYGRTAGVDYDLGDEPVPYVNQPLETGVVPLGGIPALDEQLRPEIYQQGGPTAVNQRAVESMQTQGIEPAHFNGAYASEIYSAQQPQQANTGGEVISPVNTQPLGGSSEAGILPTPVPADGE